MGSVGETSVQRVWGESAEVEDTEEGIRVMAMGVVQMRKERKR